MRRATPVTMDQGKPHKLADQDIDQQHQGRIDCIRRRRALEAKPSYQLHPNPAINISDANLVSSFNAGIN